MINLNDLAFAVEGLILRAVVRVVREAGKLRRMQVSHMAGEAPTDNTIEHFENYGFTAHPLEGAEALVVNQGADSALPVVVAVTDRRHRPTDLAEGDVAVYNDKGSTVRLDNEDVNVRNVGRINLGNSAVLSVARYGDDVYLKIPAGSLGFDSGGGAIPQTDCEFTGTIVTGSSKVFAE